jgi:hypothetical protein
MHAQQSLQILLRQAFAAAFAWIAACLFIADQVG